MRLVCGASRLEAEEALKSGKADMAICQAVNRTLGNEMEWSALGAIELNLRSKSFICRTGNTADTVFNLALEPQLVMHAQADEQSRSACFPGQSLLSTNGPC
ncbi:hypothetical protein LZ023_38445 (plasmid) [Pseudomonas silvicola]|nr:hypothetical protein LZ023_38445 [Pseudomonas silvicola]